MKNDIPVTTPLTLIDGVSGVLPVTRVQKRPFRYATAIKLPRWSADRKKGEREKRERKKGKRRRVLSGKETIKRSVKEQVQVGGGYRPYNGLENRAEIELAGKVSWKRDFSGRTMLNLHCRVKKVERRRFIR